MFSKYDLRKRRYFGVIDYLLQPLHRSQVGLVSHTSKLQSRRVIFLSVTLWPLMILGCGRANSNWRVSVAYTQTSVDLASISCPSSSDCIAVGGEQYENHPSGMEEAVIYDSGVWKLLKVNGLRRQDEVLVGSSCTRVLSCIAVGSVLGQNGSTQDGGWIVRISGHSGTSLTEIQGKLHFTGIACTSHTHCLVTGVRFTPNPVPLLEETFDARSWSRVVIPALASQQSGELSGLACAEVNECIAVGSTWPTTTFGSSKPLVYSYDGIRWSKIELANARMPAMLSSVTCLDSRSCLVVGQQGIRPTRPLVYQWNGKEWKEANISFVKRSIAMSSVACGSTTRCVGVGGGQGIGESPAVIVWNRARWSWIRSPSPSSTEPAGMQDVVCATRNLCFGVGYHWVYAITGP